MILYYSPTCRFCQRVLQYMEEANVKLTLKDIDANPAYVDELIKIGGKRQVPCLVHDGKALYESLDIIAFLKARKKD